MNFELFFEALVRAVYWRARWHDCNPEVGMGPILQELAAKELGALAHGFSTAEAQYIIGKAAAEVALMKR